MQINFSKEIAEVFHYHVEKKGFLLPSIQKLNVYISIFFMSKHAVEGKYRIYIELYN